MSDDNKSNDGENKRVERPPRREQTYVKYDVEKLEEAIERRDASVVHEEFGGPDGLMALFKSNAERGIDRASVEHRREQFGMNELKKKEPATFLEFFIEALSDQVIIILICAATVSIIFGMTLENPHTHEVDREKGWIEGTAIFISVLVVTLVGSISNYKKAKKFEEMEAEQSIKSVRAFRDGIEIDLDTRELVPGDIYKIDSGVALTCDCVTIKPQSLRMNESAITGEPDLIEKSNEGNCLLISGTCVEEGDAIVMVVAIGMDSLQGILKGSLDQEKEPTPLEEHLEELAGQIGYFGGFAALILIIALSIKEIILIETRDSKSWTPVPFLSFFLIAVALVAVAIPEGLPLAVTIALAFSMQAMMKDNCMVRVLASCETMGAATAVCSDKTGTLTQNLMTVVQGLLGEHEFMYQGVGLDLRDVSVQEVQFKDTEANPAVLGVSEPIRELYAQAIALNSTAKEVEREGKKVWTGNKTEMGMLKFFVHLGRDYEKIRETAPPHYSYPFSSAKKRMTSLVKESAEADCTTALLYTKGASETILADCKKMFDKDGNVVELTEQTRAHYDAIIVDMAKQGNRTIGIARAEKSVALPTDGSSEFPKDDPTDETELVWIGVVGIQDPMREEVPAAVKACNSAGLTVRMVTGDNIHTARAIATKCGFYEENGFDLAMTGPEFRHMSEHDRPALMELLPRLRVLARSSPSDKHVLVGLLQDQGEVVAVTGDGTNDAPALKLADVGFAMNTGTDIAKGASAMVLLDDNFASVVNAIRWGRAVNDNIKKFLQFQLAINVGGVFLTIVGSLASETSKEPFTPVQLLWLNMIMDTLAALSLATETPEDACLTRKPVYKQAPLITNRMRVFIGGHALFQVVIILLLLFLGHRWFETIDDPDRCAGVNPNDTATLAHCELVCKEVGGHMDGRFCQQGRVHSTMVFNIYILFQVFNVVNGRKIYGEMNPLEGCLTRSRSLVIIFALIGLLQALAVQFAGDFMSVTGLTGREWGICIGFGALEIIVGIIVRFIPVEDHVPEEIVEREAKHAQLYKDLTEAHQAKLMMCDSATSPTFPVEEPPKKPASNEPIA
uniref:Cation-transporting P-type ATPase N-terminal domain-containing protein n=1 Tax=Neobodo designis TaxID=312471 RepID=A0A7S1W838_NEODS|mmetsp:Transcript_620/g.2209  ORF Transcript_620/g.2209 Transcript_620/m.2209 type:complete len:1075 (+) Transcript_620:162-3386(+)